MICWLIRWLFRWQHGNEQDTRLVLSTAHVQDRVTMGIPLL